MISRLIVRVRDDMPAGRPVEIVEDADTVTMNLNRAYTVDELASAMAMAGTVNLLERQRLAEEPKPRRRRGGRTYLSLLTLPVLMGGLAERQGFTIAGF